MSQYKIEIVQQSNYLVALLKEDNKAILAGHLSSIGPEKFNPDVLPYTVHKTDDEHYAHTIFECIDCGLVPVCKLVVKTPEEIIVQTDYVHWSQCASEMLRRINSIPGWHVVTYHCNVDFLSDISNLTHNEMTARYAAEQLTKIPQGCGILAIQKNDGLCVYGYKGSMQLCKELSDTYNETEIIAHGLFEEDDE